VAADARQLFFIGPIFIGPMATQKARLSAGNARRGSFQNRGKEQQIVTSRITGLDDQA
jgi:hypothetical protein